MPPFYPSIAYVEFKTEAEAEKMFEEAQGATVQGRSIIVDYVGEKSQKGARISAGKFFEFILPNLMYLLHQSLSTKKGLRRFSRPKDLHIF